MTASAQLRRRYTQQAAVAVAVSFTLSIILAIVGARTLASSTIGSKAGGDLQFPLAVVVALELVF